jgi:FixJ family two-component response regulator
VADDRILFVDDEIAVLRGYQRVLHGEFAVSTAVGGEEGLAELQANGPYAIVISDMRMPGMSGAEFLARAREKSPESVRMLLTGYADVKSAVEAVNRGSIFRFLTKPCEKADLVEAIREGLKVYHAALAEKELLRKAEMIGRTKSDWDAADIHDSAEFEGPTGLPGPAHARRLLAGLFGADPHCYVVLFKFNLLRTIEERYGEEAGLEYLTNASQFLTRILRPDDRLFHWSHDVLLAVARRQMPAAALRKEFERQMFAPHQHLLDVDGKKIMVSISATFDLLPVARFKSFDEMFEAFDAKLIAKI